MSDPVVWEECNRLASELCPGIYTMRWVDAVCGPQSREVVVRIGKYGPEWCYATEALDPETVWVTCSGALATGSSFEFVSEGIIEGIGDGSDNNSVLELGRVDSGDRFDELRSKCCFDLLVGCTF